MDKIIICKVCNHQYSSKAKFCPSCGAKNKQPVTKKWWFWVIIAFAAIIVISSGDSSENNNVQKEENVISENSSVEIVYEVVDLQTMIDDLKDNAMKAENKYQNKYVEVTGKIANFDSDGQYISIEPVGADEWNFDTVMCYVKKDEHKQVLMEKSKGDTVIIKGKVKSIGEVMGYSIDIDEIK